MADETEITEGAIAVEGIEAAAFHVVQLIAQHVADLVSLVTANGYDGIDILDGVTNISFADGTVKFDREHSKVSIVATA